MTPTPSNNPDAPAYILAGGNSTRFGSDKARAKRHAKPLIRALADQLIALGFSVTVVGKHDGQYADLGLDTIGDIEPDQGPVAGLRTALAHRRAGWILLCSCDMLQIDERWTDALFEASRRAPDADAIAARDDRWHPFPGLYHSRLLTSTSLHDARSFQRLLAHVRATAITAAGLPPICQVNTPEQLRRADASDA